MTSKSRIEWADVTWNPVTGCSHISPGCAHCYAERLAKRLQAVGLPKYGKGFEPAWHNADLFAPLSWKRPKKVFVCSMGDLFHRSIPDQVIYDVFAVMNAAAWQTFQVLTKRPARLQEIDTALRDGKYWTPNIWIGVSVETKDYLWRIDQLRETGAHVKFVSFEPLLGPIRSLNLVGIDWVIVGGETGPGARPMEADWARAIRDMCLMARVPFFFKQWGGMRSRCRELDEQLWNQTPVASTARKGETGV